MTFMPWVCEACKKPTASRSAGRCRGTRWAGIGQSIRNAIAGMWEDAPEEARKRYSSPDAWAQAAIENVVHSYFQGHPNLRRSPNAEEMARQCSLGNPAACPD